MARTPAPPPVDDEESAIIAAARARLQADADAPPVVEIDQITPTPEQVRAAGWRGPEFEAMKGRPQ